MPNWCECELVVAGPQAELARFKEVARETDEFRYGEDEPRALSEDPFIPYPAKFRKKDEVAHAWDRENFIDGERMSGLKPGAKYSDRPKDGFNSGGYEWCITHWVTKWGICRPQVVEESSERIFYTFECAWGPCTPIIAKMGEMFPELRFELVYYEGGMGFQGRFLVENGEVMNDDSFNYAGNRGG